jgi:single-strand DNA-binding protein
MSVNKIILLGNVGKEPDVRHLDSGMAVANFTLATTEKGYKTKDGKEIPDRTEWLNIVMWNKLAEIAEKYVHKGDKLYIEGKIRTRSYDAPDGSKRYVTEVFADSMEMLSSKNKEAEKQTETNTVSDQQENIPQNDNLPF